MFKYVNNFIFDPTDKTKLCSSFERCFSNQNCLYIENNLSFLLKIKKLNSPYNWLVLRNSKAILI